MNSPSELKELRRLQGHQDEVIKVAFSPDARRALSASRNGDIYVFDLESGRSVQRVLGSGSISAIDFSSDGRHALCCNGELRLIDIDSAKTIARYSGLGSIETVALLPDGHSAVYGHMDDSVRLIELAQGRELKRFAGQQRQAECLACSGDGRFLVAGRIDAYEAEDVVLVWNMQAGGSPRRPERLMTLVSSLAISPDNQRVLTGTMDSCVYLWDLATGREVRRYDGHAGNVLGVAFSPAGDFIVSGSGTDAYDKQLLEELGVDNTVRIWDLKSGREIARGTGHERNVLSVAVSPERRNVLSGSADNTVRLWGFA
jgi:WD40 repeat protein